jgi:hypothetical protein
LELRVQATTKIKWVGSWNSKPLAKFKMGWNSKPGHNLNGLKLKATTKFEWVGTPSICKIQTACNSNARANKGQHSNGDCHFERLPPNILVFDPQDK